MPIPLAAVVGAFEVASNVANVIQVGIMVNDTLTPTLESYDSQIDTLDAKTTDWFASFNVPVPATALDALKTSADYIKQAIFDGAAMQTSMIASASDLSTNLKIPIDDALAVVENSQVAIANIAAALPGETSGYADIYRSISGTLSKQFQGDEFKKQSEEFTKRIGILAAIRGADASSAGSASNRLLAGTSGIGEAVVQDIFQRNPALYSALLEQLKEQKVDPDDWKKIKQEVRTKIFSNALAKAAPDSLISAFEGTFQGTWETIKTQLFDPISGILGVLRKVDSQGGMTLLDSVNAIFQSLNNIKERVVEALAGLGYNFDPFHYLIEFFKFINESIGMLVAAGISKDPFKALGDWLSAAPETIAGWITNAIKFVSSLLEKLLDSGISGSEVGSAVGSIMNMFEVIKDKVLDNLDVAQIAELYFRVQREIALMQHAIWWESIKIIPTRIGNWFSELWLGFMIALAPVRVGFSKFADLFTKLIEIFIVSLEMLFSPITFLSQQANKINSAIPAVPSVTLPDTSELKIDALTATKAAVNPLGTVVDLGNNLLQSTIKKLTAPKPANTTTNNKRTAFAPVINLNGNSGDSRENLAALVMDELIAAYQTYTDNSLA